MKNYSKIIGIDISKSTLDLCVLNNDKEKKTEFFKIENEAKAIAGFLKKYDADTVMLCMEDTGVYGMRLCVVLSDKGFDFSVVPAIQIRRSMGLKRGKSDKTDAMDIARYALKHLDELPLFKMAEPDLQELRIMMAEREKLVRAIKIFRSTTETVMYATKGSCKAVAKHSENTLNLLQKQLEKMDKMMAELIYRNEHMRRQSELLQSIPGIGPQTSIYLIAYTRCFTAFQNWRQFACYSGVAPFPYESGTSIRGRTKVSHYAQKKIKSLLHLAAINAKRFDMQMAQYYERKVGQGKNKMSVVNAVRCKVVARAFAVIKRDKPYVNTVGYLS